MAKTINKVELLGRVGNDPEMRYTASGIAVTQLRLATDRGRKNGEDATDWHTVVVWDKLGEAVAQYVEKGQRSTSRAGWCRARGTGDDGQRRYRTEVHAQEVVFLDSSRNGNGGKQRLRVRQRRRQHPGRRPPLLTGQPDSDARHRRTQHGAAPYRQGAAPLSFPNPPARK